MYVKLEKGVKSRLLRLFLVRGNSRRDISWSGVIQLSYCLFPEGNKPRVLVRGITPSIGQILPVLVDGQCVIW